jgi:type II secretory pathway pseudopilin PulG
MLTLRADNTMIARSGRCADQGRPAFTMFELVLVLAIIVVLGAMFYPSIDNMYSSSKVEASADQVRAAWATARAHAMEEGRSYRFAVKHGASDFRVAPDSNKYWTSSGTPDEEDPRNPAYIKEDKLSNPIVFNMVELPDPNQAKQLDPTVVNVDALNRAEGNWSTVAVFLPDGTAENDASIGLTSGGGKPTYVRLRALTGVVTTRAPIDGGTDQ